MSFNVRTMMRPVKSPMLIAPQGQQQQAPHTHSRDHEVEDIVVSFSVLGLNSRGGITSGESMRGGMDTVRGAMETTPSSRRGWLASLNAGSEKQEIVL